MASRKSQSEFACECGYTEHADHVAAINILAAGLAVSACEIVELSSRKQEPAGNGDVLPLQIAV